ncbi:glycosyltransferase [Pseudoduganella chitinolytica]|uniref:Glycosyltransferase n=1 Tax=Pseudoduganella chitinolytica TaxID=34070 RepID=A0ABY8BIE5_9BURK|nr:glycosyltransferase [Pseudoduganella chitinolytica]WEF35669.1 glycosyltransferase [Pseudoduganella chitinolytica]
MSNTNEASTGRGRPVRILQLVPEALPTFRADVAVLFGKYLPRYGVECDVVGKGSKAAVQEQGFASVRRAPLGARWKTELSFAWLCLRTMLSARRGQCDVIQARDMVSLGTAGLLIARLRGIRFAYWMSFLMCEARIDRARARLRAGGGLRDRLVLLKGLAEYALLHKVVLRHADHVFVQSDAMLELLASQGVPREKMSAVPMGVDMEVLSTRPQPRRLPGWEGVPLLAYLGTLDPMRDIHMVIDALVLIRRNYPTARLLLVGDAPHKVDVERLLAHAAASGVGDAVHVTGWLPSAEAWQLLAGADVAVSYFPRGTVLDTNSPTKILEYMALGIPSLGNDNPDQQMVMLESQAGWLTPSTPEGLAEAACGVLADPQGAARRAAAGPPYIESKRSYRVLAEGVARRYAALLATR